MEAKSAKTIIEEWLKRVPQHEDHEVERAFQSGKRIAYENVLELLGEDE